MSSTSTFWPFAALFTLGSLGLLVLQRSGGIAAPAPAPVAAGADPVATQAAPAAWPLRAPDPATIPEGPLGESIRRGEALVRFTKRELPDHVGADMQCTSCHLKGGTVPNAGPWVGVTGVFPEYRSRNAHVNTLEERVNDCFERSLNGAPLPLDSPDMVAIIAYMQWLSKGDPVGVPIEGRGFPKLKAPAPPDKARGATIYAQRCQACHGPSGAGVIAADGTANFPPLWGPKSFNIGAGMARQETAAGFIQANMPLGQAGTLTAQEAADVAAYVVEQQRPDYAEKEEDWAKGGKPPDARY